ncbi:MAG: hypothetical protein WBL61_01250, partial [Bryobacteraceae bacterium]
NLEPKTKKGDRPLRGRPLTFQDHLVLETESDFRIILRLENAAAEVAIPAGVLDRAQGSPWREPRLNLCRYDHTAPTAGPDPLAYWTILVWSRHGQRVTIELSHVT